MSVNCSAGNCGIGELYGLSAPTKDLITQVYGFKYVHFWFSDADSNGNGERLRKEIISMGLGSLVQSPSAVNPNSNNHITAYVWTPNKVAVKAYLGIK